ncbi:MAG: VWA domain-containing protein [Bifidobacteriaceae bacterium]|jgi:Ca-activated chloride channel family protein|nr:VWA domain-containing protein [Bifidobacteriaceae bacterium]
MTVQLFFPLWLTIIFISFILLGLAAIFIKIWEIKKDYIATDAKPLDWLRRALILLLIGFIILGPSWQVGEALQPQPQTNVLFVVDRTGSMNAEDFAANKSRLDGAKDDMKKIINLYTDAQFGLITFDSVAITQVPLTYDSSGVISYINALTPQITKYSQGTKIDISASEIGNDLRAARIANSKSKNFIYFLSDGENNVGDNAANPQLSAFDTVKDYIDGGAVIGYGSLQGSKIKPYNFNSQSDRIGKNQDVITSEYIKDPAKGGQDAISKINPVVLTALAKDLSLQYFYSDSKIDLTNFINVSNVEQVNLLQRDLMPIIQPTVWPFELLIGLLVIWEFYHFVNMAVSTRGI